MSWHVHSIAPQLRESLMCAGGGGCGDPSCTAEACSTVVCPDQPLVLIRADRRSWDGMALCADHFRLWELENLDV